MMAAVAAKLQVLLPKNLMNRIVKNRLLFSHTTHELRQGTDIKIDWAICYNLR